MKTAAVTIRLDPKLEELPDEVCRETGQSRSEVVREALRRQLTLRLFEEVRLGTTLKLGPEPLASVTAVLDRCAQAPASSDPSPVPVRDPDDEKILADAVAAGVQIPRLRSVASLDRSGRALSGRCYWRGQHRGDTLRAVQRAAETHTR